MSAVLLAQDKHFTSAVHFMFVSMCVQLPRKVLYSSSSGKAVLGIDKCLTGILELAECTPNLCTLYKVKGTLHMHTPHVVCLSIFNFNISYTMNIPMYLETLLHSPSQ